MRSDPGSNRSGVHTPPLLPGLAGPQGAGQGAGLGVSSARPAWRSCLLTASANTLSRDSANSLWAAKQHSSSFSCSCMTLHFFGWLDRKPGTCSGSCRFAVCKRQPRSVLAAPPRPSSVLPPPCPHCLGQQAAVATGSGQDHSAPGSEPTQRPRGCRWPRKPLVGYFWPLCWPVDSLPKAISEFSSCFADGLEYVKNVLLGDPRALWGGGEEWVLGSPAGAWSPRTRPLGLLASRGRMGASEGCLLQLLPDGASGAQSVCRH